MGNTLQTPPSPPTHESTHGHEEHHRINNSKEQEVSAESSEEEFYDVEEEHDDDDDDDDDEFFTCEICIEPTTKKSTHAIISCTHQYCVDCTIKYIKVKIEDDNEPRVKCPAPNCTHALDPVACAPLVGPAVFVRWCDALCRSSLSGVADTCYCPYADCSELLFSDCKDTNGNTKANKCQCPMCKRWFCSACKKVWHAGFGCEDVPTDRADVAFGRLVERMTWMRCPNCRHFVERRGGCRVVKCRCGIRFCYKCGKKVVEGWCNCEGSYNVERCCSWCIRCFIILALLMLPWLSLLHNKHNHPTHNNN